MRRTLLIDLDGTLVDSVPGLQASITRLMARYGLPGFTGPQIAAMVGDGAAALVERAMAAQGRTAGAQDVADFVADYTSHAATGSVPYPGVPETLHDLAGSGWRLAVCTNKPEQAARVLLEALGLLGFFAAVGGGDSFPVRKPDPAHLLATLAAAGGDLRSCVMLGDHHNDVQAAAAASMPCIFAAWGYGPAAMAAGSAATADCFAAVPAIAARLTS